MTITAFTKNSVLGLILRTSNKFELDWIEMDWVGY